MKLFGKCFVAAMLLLILSIGLADAGTPQLVSYQGRLTDSDGEPVEDGNYDLTLSIWDALSTGNSKWSETQLAVPVKAGLFTIQLGAVNPLPDSVFDGDLRYLEVSVNGQALSPRTQFTSVGFANRIASVDGAAGGQISGELQIVGSDEPLEGTGISILGESESPALTMTVDEFDRPVISLFDPVDSKGGQNLAGDKTLEMRLDQFNRPVITMFDPVDSKFGQASLKALEMRLDEFNRPVIAMFDPVDSKARGAVASLKVLEMSIDGAGKASMNFFDPADSKAGVETPKVTLNKEGLFMFGLTEFDTSLVMDPNGDIRGLGQITMGENAADGDGTTVLGENNIASGDSSAVGGGSYNEASGTSSTISGGFGNTAEGTGSTIGGGSTNSATGDYSTVPGGFGNSAAGAYSWAGGRRAMADFDGSFVWADHTDDDFAATAEDQFIIRAGGGVGIGTNNPQGALDVVGDPGDESVNLPENSIGPSEVFGESGLAATRSAMPIVLDQEAGAMQDLATVSITTPGEGYIMVRGGVTVRASGTLGQNLTYVQIDEYAGGSTTAPFFATVGARVGLPNLAADYRSAQVERIYFMPAGTYEFRIEAQAADGNGGSAVAEMQQPYITAIFIPTAYGTVSNGQAVQDFGR